MHALSLLTDPHAWAALVTLTALEIVLGIDNLVFIAVLTWLVGLTAPLFSIFGMGISWRDIILVGGGMFLIAKATHEIHGEVEASDSSAEASASSQAFSWIVVQLV